jgi:hypothetical protein
VIPEGNGPFARTIHERIAWARKVFEIRSVKLAADPETARLSAEFENARMASRLATASAGITSLCALCDREEGGSCCGAGIELKYDGWLLLVNLHLGVWLPERRIRPGGCFFLGENGCMVAARHVLCVNYLCRSVIEKVDPSALLTLREREGREIDFLFRLNERIKRVIRQGG